MKVPAGLIYTYVFNQKRVMNHFTVFERLKMCDKCAILSRLSMQSGKLCPSPGWGGNLCSMQIKKIFQRRKARHFRGDGQCLLPNLCASGPNGVCHRRASIFRRGPPRTGLEIFLDRLLQRWPRLTALRRAWFVN